MALERFGRDIRRDVLRHAEREADALGAPAIGAEHLLLGVALTEGPGCALSDAGLDAPSVRDALEADLADALAPLGIPASAVEAVGPPVPTGRRLRLAPAAKRSLHQALRTALDGGDRRIHAGHLAVGILRTPSAPVQRLLDRLGVDRDALVRALSA
ncbi:MAG TPA: Clp protease N-terminal domain-containing protein [Capillimicrobium sp.]|nr:Clp protease N-terminal domain-containing protein [Capillimicrobium sp.]